MAYGLARAILACSVRASIAARRLAFFAWIGHRVVTAAELSGSRRLLKIASTFLVQIPGQLDHGQKNVFPAPPGGNRRLDNSADERQQLALAFGRQVDLGAVSRRTIEIKSHHWRSPAINDLVKRISLQFYSRLIYMHRGRNTGASELTVYERVDCVGSMARLKVFLGLLLPTSHLLDAEPGQSRKAIGIWRKVPNGL